MVYTQMATPPASKDKAAVIKAVVDAAEADMAADRKTTALKSLQVQHTGNEYSSAEC